MNQAISTACNRIAPLWPLKHFVAVNPFLGFTGQSFEATCATMRRVARTDMLMPRDYHRCALAADALTDRDLTAALAAAPSHWKLPDSAAALRKAAERDAGPLARPDATVATVAEVLDSLASGDRHASRTLFMIDEISKWCAAYFDDAQSVWRLPTRGQGLYAAWRESMRHDRNPEIMGVRGFRDAVAAMPDNAMEAIVSVVEALGIPDRAVEDYLHRALFDIGGWAAYARYLVWNSDLNGKRDDTLVELLAVRVVWGYALFLELRDPAFLDAWKKAMQAAERPQRDQNLGDDPELAIDLLLQLACEHAYQRELLENFSRGTAIRAGKHAAERPAVQAAFCIDVRSEVYRRALEAVCPQAETVGFAGFFGFPIEYVPVGNETGGPQCPVLLKPAFVVCEGVAGASLPEATRILELRRLRRRTAKAWKSFKVSAISSFTFVETAGIAYAAKILGDSLGLTRTVKDPHVDGIDAAKINRLGPTITSRDVGGRQTGFDDAQKLDMAEAVLRAMSMTTNFARLVMLVGHGSTTVNNPHGSGLDCGACGGHTGEANARVAAAILNDHDVRVGLVDRGIAIPEDTWFLGCLHDTTTDDIALFGRDAVPVSHTADIEKLLAWLEQASSLARRERASGLRLADAANTDAAIKARSRDWSQVRPEWGLAGNAAFIAGPRSLTRHADFQGRAFLHSYDWASDKDFGVLKLIMTAPMVVASWINLQYYGSTVNNPVFGAGNKVLHNVTSAIGVLEGNSGDLRVGLPWQSVHDGEKFVHQPLRLNVIIAAPCEAMNTVIAENAGVRDLVDNHWLYLFALADDGRITHRYAGGLKWDALS